MAKKDIRNFTLGELKEIIISKDEPAYRAGQIFSWLYKKGVASFSSMKNLPKDLQTKLDNDYYIGALELSDTKKSKDKTEKFLFKLRDGNFIETVLVPSKKRKTICISTQVGCRFKCTFCSSGRKGLVRNLTLSEIISQILFLIHELKHEITNYVFMGMGEPLDNYENLIKAIKIMNDPDAMGIGARRITVSTCGVIPGIEKLKDFKPQIKLSISLHAANDELRNELVPANKIYPLKELIKSCKGFVEKKGRTVTLEYVLIKGKNDFLKDASELVSVARKLNAKVNLIPYSPSRYFKMQPTSKDNQEKFFRKLESEEINVTLRESKGKDIQAACGQLAGSFD